jgi:hypothetical protein
VFDRILEFEPATLDGGDGDLEGVGGGYHGTSSMLVKMSERLLSLYTAAVPLSMQHPLLIPRSAPSPFRAFLV